MKAWYVISLMCAVICSFNVVLATTDGMPFREIYAGVAVFAGLMTIVVGISEINNNLIHSDNDK
jgi:hypothetical protein